MFFEKVLTYEIDYRRRLFKKLQIQGAARLQAVAYSCTLSIEAAAATQQMDFFNSLLDMKKASNNKLEAFKANGAGDRT